MVVCQNDANRFRHSAHGLSPMGAIAIRIGK
jgi:hypothetical protein